MRSRTAASARQNGFMYDCGTLLILAVAALFGFAGSALAQTPAPADNKDTKPALTQPMLRKGKVIRKAKKMRRMAAKPNAAAIPVPVPAPAPAAPGTK